jgi:Nuclease-related domain.
VIVSRFGIFAIETKNMQGWIFGSERQAEWTQKIFKRSFRFQNPLRQNYKHTKALQAALQVPPEAIHSVVVFVGGSTFKTEMPANVTYGGGCVRFILSFTQPVFDTRQVQRLVQQLQTGRLAPTRPRTSRMCSSSKSATTRKPSASARSAAAPWRCAPQSRAQTLANSFGGALPFPGAG